MQRQFSLSLILLRSADQGQIRLNARRHAGAHVWYDEHNLGSDQLGPTIEREPCARSLFVVILSPAALKSRWVEDEVR
jgi:hypothetical protein